MPYGVRLGKTEKDQMRQAYADGESQGDIAKRFGVDQATVSRAVKDIRGGPLVRDRYNDRGERFCTSCKRYLSPVAFGKNRAISDGLHVYCKPCNAAKMRASYHADPELWNQRRNESLQKWRKSSPEKLQAQYDRHNARMREFRKEVLAAYGGRCACCGESTFEFLSIDHVNNDGAQHRRQVGQSSAVYRWLKKNGYPEGFQVLCFNCNMAKQFFGQCPHQRKE